MDDMRRDDMIADAHGPDAGWLAADYHIPSTYSLRTPMSSMGSGLALPAPGPATVRLALVRTGIELFGEGYTRDVLFPAIRRAGIRVRPPERVAISDQPQRAYKGVAASAGAITDYGALRESLVYREMAHAHGTMTVYVEASPAHADALGRALMAVGYWGRADSLAWCAGVRRGAPPRGECATPLSSMDAGRPLRPYVTTIVSEFDSGRVEWDDVMPSASGRRDAIRMDLYVWPLVVAARHDAGRVLHRRPLC